MGDFEPIHAEVWEKMDKQAKELYQLKRANINLRNRLRRSRIECGKLREELRATLIDKPKYRNQPTRGKRK